MPRDCRAPADVGCGGGTGPGRWKAADAGGGTPFPPGGHHRPRGQEGAHSDRISCVCNVGTPLRSSRWLVGRPRGRRNAAVGTGWSKKRIPVRRKATGKRHEMIAPPSRSCRITGRIRAREARLERGLTWTGWICEENGRRGVGTEGQVGRWDAADGHGRGRGLGRTDPRRRTWGGTPWTGVPLRIEYDDCGNESSRQRGPGTTSGSAACRS